MTRHFHHFTAEERAAIMLMQPTHSIRAMARYLGRVPSTVSRKLSLPVITVRRPWRGIGHA
ncbi:Helix-turn-helix domain-containing protein [Modicisalibacter muralis]|uniref:Helix-turn-helix domain-containing protein n=1 Tax=Modicisalibacter muralis TaxID=119000 RepID=A0A1G9M0E2_9GAMM|nr:Helix-turn-helix domain-containing protein [Halomonas muralis]